MAADEPAVLFLGPQSSPAHAYLAARGGRVEAASEPLDPAALADSPPDWIVSHGYRHIVPAELVERFAGRAVNLHISLLPWNRGADPNLWSFVEGTPSGVTVHHMDAGLDTGDVVAQRQLEFGDEETLATTYAQLQDAVVALFREVWPALLAGEAPRRPQSGPGSYHRSADRARVESLLVDGWETRVGELRRAAASRSGQ